VRPARRRARAGATLADRRTDSSAVSGRGSIARQRAAGARSRHRLGLHRHRLRQGPCRVPGSTRSDISDCRPGSRAPQCAPSSPRAPGCEGGVRKSDHFRALGRRKPTISSSSNRLTWAPASSRGLPPEYRHEPRVALAAGQRRASTRLRIILREARRAFAAARGAHRRGWGTPKSAGATGIPPSALRVGLNSSAVAAEDSCSRASNCRRAEDA